MFILFSFRNSLLNHVSLDGHWVRALISTWHASLCMCLETKFGCDLCALPHVCIDREFVCENTWDPLITTSNQIYPSIKQCSSIKNKCIHTHTGVGNYLLSSHITYIFSLIRWVSIALSWLPLFDIGILSLVGLFFAEVTCALRVAYDISK